MPVESGIQKCFLVNPESWLSVESEIQLKESGIPLTIGIRNPSSTDKNPESSPWSPESVAWNRQSKTFLDSLIWQSDLILSVVYSRLQDKKYGREVFFNEKGKRIQVDYWSNQERGHLCLFWQLTISSVLIPSWQRFDSSVRRMRCIFPLSNLKRLIHLYDSMELTTSQRPSLSIEHSFGGAIYPFMVAKKRIFRAYTSQVWVRSIWKHC